MRRVLSALIAATAAAVWFQPAHGLGRPGLTPVACPTQTVGNSGTGASTRCQARKRSRGVTTAASIKSKSPRSGTAS